MDNRRRNISLKVLAFVVGMIIASLISCEKDEVEDLHTTTPNISHNNAYMPQVGVSGYYYESGVFWYGDTLQGTEFPIGASFATYYNDSVTESSVELVAWTGDSWALYSDMIILEADSFYFNTTTGYQLEVQYEVLSGSVGVDTLYGTWVFKSGDNGSKVVVNSLKLHNSN